MFIDVLVSEEAAADAALIDKLVEVCPVSIFAKTDAGGIRIVEEHLDECTLCDLCIEAAPAGAVAVVKLYE